MPTPYDWLQLFALMFFGGACGIGKWPAVVFGVVFVALSTLQLYATTGRFL